MNLKISIFPQVATFSLRLSNFSESRAVFMVFVWCHHGGRGGRGGEGGGGGGRGIKLLHSSTGY